MKQYLAKIESKGLKFYYIVHYDPASISPIENALLEQARKSTLVQDKYRDAEFIEIPSKVFKQFRKEYGNGHHAYMAHNIARELNF